MRNDVILYILAKGKMLRTPAEHGNSDRRNFLIVCDYGDWSGFRTLADCVKQFPELEATGTRPRPEGFFMVVERF